MRFLKSVVNLGLQSVNRITIQRNALVTVPQITVRWKSTDPASRPLQNIALQPKKRLVRSKKFGLSEEEQLKADGFLNVSAYSTAEEYDLEGLKDALKEQNLYSTKKLISTDSLGVEHDVLYVTANYQVDNEPRDIFFFREGSVVLWNCNEIESNNVLSFLRSFEKDKDNAVAKFRNGQIFLTGDENDFLEKYTFSNAIATSTKLGIWEANLERYIESMEYITEDLKKGRKLKITRSEVLRKTGELFALRHMINLSSDLLDTPDFYWDREELENIYLSVCNYFSIPRRTKVMNEKINHCLELAELVSHNLNDAHHIRLEWMIIILIMVEVGFEIVHYIDRYYSNDDEDKQAVVSSH
uniref:DUF155 domain-containing protein n=1 Tax=Megaselia scalaris TaxID=36166 RepID=T1H4N9_MEGSC